MANIFQRLSQSFAPVQRSFNSFIKSAFKNSENLHSNGETEDDCPNGDCGKKGDKGCSKISYYSIAEKVRGLPFIHEAADLKARLILSQGISFIPRDKKIQMDVSDATKKKIEEDRMKLHKVFDRDNGLSQNLYEMNFSKIVETELFGHSGLQAYDWVSPEKVYFQSINWNQFLIVVNELKKGTRGRRDILYYLIDLMGFSSEENIKLKQDDSNNSDDQNSETRYKIIPYEFVQYRLNTETPYGVSPLYYDTLLTQLIIDVIKDNIETVNNNGWKGIVVKGVKGMSPHDMGLKSEALPDNWQDLVVQKFLGAVRKSIQGQKNKDNVMFLNGSIVDDFQQLDRGFKSLEYMKVIEDKASIIAASMLGLLAAFLGDKNSTYASNIGEAIKFAVNYSITPSQQKYANILTKDILDRYINNTGYLNYEYDVVFNPIDLSDPKVEADTLNSLADFATKLRKEGFGTINEMVKFINQKIRDIDLSQLDDPINGAGDIKTTVQVLLPVNVEDMPDTEPESKKEDKSPDEEKPEEDKPEEKKK